MSFMKSLDLQAKISLVLGGVILPTFLIVTVAENKITRPILEDEMRQIGITAGKSLAAEVAAQRLMQLPNPTPRIEERVQELLYTQPNIVRMDVIAKDAITGLPRTVASNIEEDPAAPSPPFPLVDTLTTDYRADELGKGFWEINVPIEQKARDPHGHRKLLGTVRLLISMGFVDQIVLTLWKVTASGATFSVVMLILALGYFLRKTIANDRLLKQAENQNSKLTAQLHDAQRQVMNTEKLAVMGQLTASFAHEIGTPLNAIAGHLQLLKDEITEAEPATVPEADRKVERLEIINGQVSKIEGIVKGFLHSTAKPTSQRQLVDLNQLASQTLAIVAPRIELMGVEARKKLDSSLGPLRVVPLDFEQILLNLVNNSLDSLREKQLREGKDKFRGQLALSTRLEGQWALLTVYDTGEGIKKADLSNVFKPFFTTKAPGEGTGLGLTICQQLARKHGGDLVVDSKEGAWTRISLKIPYQVNT